MQTGVFHAANTFFINSVMNIIVHMHMTHTWTFVTSASWTGLRGREHDIEKIITKLQKTGHTISLNEARSIEYGNDIDRYYQTC